eukprot:2307537-Amphidinium_carterae.1
MSAMNAPARSWCQRPLSCFTELVTFRGWAHNLSIVITNLIVHIVERISVSRCPASRLTELPVGIKHVDAIVGVAMET